MLSMTWHLSSPAPASSLLTAPLLNPATLLYLIFQSSLLYLLPHFGLEKHYF